MCKPEMRASGAIGDPNKAKKAKKAKKDP